MGTESGVGVDFWADKDELGRLGAGGGDKEGEASTGVGMEVRAAVGKDPSAVGVEELEGALGGR